MAQIWKVRLPDGRIVRPTEWSSTPLWSTVELGTGAQTPLIAFSYGRGGDVPGSLGPRKSTLSDTNLRGDGDIMPENEELLIYSVLAELYMIVATPVIPTGFFVGNDPGCPDPPMVGLRNMLRVQRDVNLVLSIAETKNYYNTPLSWFPLFHGDEELRRCRPQRRYSQPQRHHVGDEREHQLVRQPSARDSSSGAAWRGVPRRA